MAIKNKKLLPLLKEYPHFRDQFNLNVLNNYDENVRKPLIIKKKEDIEQYLKRKDYEELLYLHDDPKESRWVYKTRNEIYLRNVKIIKDCQENE